MGILGKMLGTDAPAGFAKMDVIFGYWDGMAWPAGALVYATVAPITPRDSLFGIREFNGPTVHHILPHEVDSMEITSNGWTFFGFGAAGAISASLAGAVDRQLAPWDVHVSGPGGSFQLHAWGGLGCPPPGAHTWGRVEERIARYRASQSLRVEPELAVTDVDDDDGPWGSHRGMLRTFVDAAEPLSTTVNDIDRLQPMIDDPYGYAGIERVEADLLGRHCLGSKFLTEDEYELVIWLLHLLMQSPAEHFEASDLDAAVRVYAAFAKICVRESGSAVAWDALAVANAAFLEYVDDPVALATVGILTKTLLEALEATDA